MLDYLTSAFQNYKPAKPEQSNRKNKTQQFKNAFHNERRGNASHDCGQQ